MIKQTLVHFTEVSGLMPNLQKSEVFFFSGVEQEIITQILQELGFKEASLPIKYLGLPLISTKLNKDHCMEFI